MYRRGRRRGLPDGESFFFSCFKSCEWLIKLGIKKMRVTKTKVQTPNQNIDSRTCWDSNTDEPSPSAPPTHAPFHQRSTAKNPNSLPPSLLFLTCFFGTSRLTLCLNGLKGERIDGKRSAGRMTILNNYAGGWNWLEVSGAWVWPRLPCWSRV